MIYKEDVLMALETYVKHQKSNHNKYYNEITFLNHYCRKFSIPKSRYKDFITRVYLEYMEVNK